MKKVSVIIPSYNRKAILCDCLRSVLDSEYDNLEVIVVDNNSNDGTANEVLQNFSAVKVIELNINLMAAGGRNEGIKHATGDYLLFLDNDNIIDRFMISELVKVMESDEKIGLCGPISINVNESDRIWTASGDYNFFTSKPINLYEDKKYGEIELKKKYATCYSPNAMMIRKEAVEKVGGFDTNYYAMYEEADIGYRIKKAGYSGFIVCSALTRHLGYVSKDEQSKLRLLGIGFPERAYHFAKNRFIFMKKYAKWYQRIVFYLCFSWAFTLYYCGIAMRYDRFDIAKQYFAGTIRGLFSRTNKEIYFNIY